jgi:hypothetical protein
MRWADLVLSYVQAVAWPVVAIFAIVLFRNQIRQLILSARKLSMFGAEAEFERLEHQVRTAEKELNRVITPKNASTPRSEMSKREREIVASLTQVSFADLDSLSPLAAATEITSRLDEVTNRILAYFGLPAKVIDDKSAGTLMESITGDSRWPNWFTLRRLQRRIVELLNRDYENERPKYQKKMDEEAKRITGAAIWQVGLLPKMFENPHVSWPSNHNSGSKSDQIPAQDSALFQTGDSENPETTPVALPPSS